MDIQATHQHETAWCYWWSNNSQTHTTSINSQQLTALTLPFSPSIRPCNAAVCRPLFCKMISCYVGQVILAYLPASSSRGAMQCESGPLHCWSREDILAGSGLPIDCWRTGLPSFTATLCRFLLRAEYVLWFGYRQRRCLWVQWDLALEHSMETAATHQISAGSAKTCRSQTFVLSSAGLFVPMRSDVRQGSTLFGLGERAWDGNWSKIWLDSAKQTWS